MLLVGTGITATMSVGLSLTHSYLPLVILMCIYSIGTSFIGSSAQAMLADTVPTSTPSGIAAFQMAGDVGVILGPLVAGAILDLASMTWAWLVGAIIIGIGFTLSWFTPSAIQPAVGDTGLKEKSLNPD
jgi:MFS family permease